MDLQSKLDNIRQNLQELGAKIEQTDFEIKKGLEALKSAIEETQKR